MPATSRSTVSRRSADHSDALRQRAETILNREEPCVFARQLRNPSFVDSHLAVAEAVVQSASRTSTSDATGQSAALGQDWNLPDLLTPDQERSLFVALNAMRHEFNAIRSTINPRRPARTRLQRAEEALQQADRFRQHLCEANIRLVISLAGKMADQLVSFDDLFGEGLMILLKAIDGFDFSKGFRFSTYATNSLQRHFFRLKKRTLRKRQFGAPIADEILHTASDWGDGVGLSPDDPVKLTRKLLRAAHRVLDQRERRIVALRFGLEGSEHTLREIAAVLRVSKERVRQVLVRAVGKLQDVATNLRMEWTPRELAAPARLGA